MFDYIKFGILLLQIVKAYIDYLQKNKYISEGRAQVVRENLEKSHAELEAAQKARQRVRDGIAADPDSVHGTDPFERKD